MRYDYVCDSCSHEIFDYYQSINDDPITRCEKCGEDSLRRLISGGSHAFVKNTNTIGALADRNAKANASKINEIEAKKKESSAAKKDQPWYKKSGTASSSEINSMSKKQKQDYIMKGKK